MASANLELVRSIYAGWGRGDFDSVEWAHDDMEFVGADGPFIGHHRGLAEVAEGWREVLSAWEGLRAEAEEYRELDSERVLVFHQWSGRGKASGLEVGAMRTSPACVFHIRDGKVSKMTAYWDRERALDDLGLLQRGG